MADWPSFFSRSAGHRLNFLTRVFPERQILVRDNGKIRCFKISSFQQLGFTASIAVCVLWAMLSTAAYLDRAHQLNSKEDEISQRAQELEGLKANYQAAFGRLDEFQRVFASITCEITDIQDSLLKITERSVTTKRGAIVGAMPRLDPDPSGCRVTATTAPALDQQDADGNSGDTRRIVGSLKDTTASDREILRHRVGQLDQALDKLRASHGAFLQNTANLTALKIGELEKTLAAVGVDARNVGHDVDRRQAGGNFHMLFGKGGPFIAAKHGVAQPDPVDFNPVALFNTHADRLDSLNTALRNLPLAAPLVDFEVTSPFGSRNDPINAMTGIHEGVDLGAPTGTPVMATGDGEVVWSGWRDRYGLMVEIDHGMGVHTRYAHLSKALVTSGERIKRGATLGMVGETGRTTGPHLHYEVRMGDQATNPMKFITAGQNVFKTQ